MKTQVSTRQERRSPGRPKHFDFDSLRDVWVYVEFWKAVAGLSAHQICLKGSFDWIRGGPLPEPNNKGTGRLKHSAAKKTLLRRYYEACACLRSDTALFGTSHTEKWWQRVVDEQLARYRAERN